MTMRPQPDIIINIPTPLWLRARNAYRELLGGIAFVRETFRRERASKHMAELSAFERMVALNINSASTTRTISGGF